MLRDLAQLVLELQGIDPLLDVAMDPWNASPSGVHGAFFPFREQKCKIEKPSDAESMKICLAAYNERIAAVFDTANLLRIFEAENGRIVFQKDILPPGPGTMARLSLLLAAEVDCLICGALCRGSKISLEQSGILVLDWIRGEIDSVLTAWKAGRIEELKMPGCLKERRHCRRRGRPSTGRQRVAHPTASINHQNKERSMIIAISSQGESLDAALDPRFGRCKGFIIFDPSGEPTRFISNEQNLNAPQGAGIQTAQNVAQSGAEAVITGHIGPKAFRALQAGGIQVYLTQAATVQEAIEAYREGRLQASEGADKPGHW